MDIKDYVRIIESAFPQFKINKVHTMQQGWDSFVVSVNETYVFRFPLRPLTEKCLDSEIKLLPELARVLPVPIPNFEYIWTGSKELPQMFVGYPMIQGVPLSIIPPFESTRKEEIAKLLGQTLTELHSYPTEKAVEAGLEPRNIQRWKEIHVEMLEKHRKISFPLMEPALQRKSMDIFEKYLENDEYFEFEPVLIHGDLAPDAHVLWEPEAEEITGIIDWGDIRIGDPALDFTGLLCDCGPEFTKMVLEYYKRPFGHTILERAAWYIKFSGFYHIEYGQIIGENSYIEEGLKLIREL